MHLPPHFIDTIHGVFGDAGRAWLPRLPSIVARCRARWGLSASVVSPAMSLNYLEFATTAAGECVALKVGVPHPELYSEMEALALYAGKHAVRLLDADQELGALLLQRLRPGTVLWRLGDNARETRIAASIMAELHAPPPATHGMPAFARWVRRAFSLTRSEWDPEERMPRDLLDAAERAFFEIERTAPCTVVLHGDLHHENILYDDRSGWTAIDPKGAIGAPILEVGRFTQNQLPGSLSPARREVLVRERVAVFSAELGYTKEAVAASALVDCVLSHCWSLEDEALSEEWHLGVELAQLLRSMAGLQEKRAHGPSSHRE